MKRRNFLVSALGVAGARTVTVRRGSVQLPPHSLTVLKVNL